MVVERASHGVFPAEASPGGDVSELGLSTFRPGADPVALTQVTRLLAAVGLGRDADIELFVAAHRGDRLVGCLGLAGAVVKCAASDPGDRGAGVAARLMGRLTDEAQALGRTHLFAFTAPPNQPILERLGFHTLAQAPGDAVFLENTPFGLSSYVEALHAFRRPGARVGGLLLDRDEEDPGRCWLVTQAASLVDVLHVFVQTSPAGDDVVRVGQVRSAVAEVGLGDRVVVHTATPYAVSPTAFPSYFLPDAGRRAAAAVTLELRLFRSDIAPALGITDRFVAADRGPTRPAALLRRWLEQAPETAPPVRLREIDPAHHSPREANREGQKPDAYRP